MKFIVYLILVTGLFFFLKKSKISRNLKRIISGSFMYITYLITSTKLKGVFGSFDHSTDVILTHIIGAPFAIWILGWLFNNIIGEGNEN